MSEQRRVLAVGITIVLYASLAAVGVHHSFTGSHLHAGGAATTQADEELQVSGDTSASAEAENAAALNTAGAAGVNSGTGQASAGSRSAAAATAAAASQTRGTVAGAPGGTVLVGIRYPVNSNGLMTSVGFHGIQPGDSKAMAQAVVNDVNARGGLAGRRIEPVYVPFDVTGSVAPGGSDSEQQKACTGFTEDHKVFAVISPIISGQLLQSCLADRGVAFVDDNWGFFDQAKAGSGYFDPAYPDPVRGISANVDRLAATGFFNAGAKIGVVFQDMVDRRRVLDQGLIPALARHGLKLEGTVAWTGQNADQLAAGVLKFRSMGITHVFVVDPGGLETFGWMSEAESQAYRPFYALDTRNYLFLQASQSPRAQLAKARGIGWVPNADLGTVPPDLLSANDRRCLSTVAPARQDMADPTNVRVSFAYCDTLEFLKEAAGSAPTLSLAAVKAGGEALGDRHAAVGTFQARFGPGRHDGAAAARDIAYDTGCGCFRYSGPVFPI